MLQPQMKLDAVKRFLGRNMQLLMWCSCVHTPIHVTDGYRGVLGDLMKREN